MADERRVYVEDPRFTGQRGDDRGGTPVTVVYEEPPKRGCMKSCFMGCLFVAVILFVVGLVLAFWIARNWREWAADFGSQAIKESLDQTDLPEAEKAEIGVEVDRLAQAFRDGRISTEKAAELMQKLAVSPLATSIIVSVVNSKYLDRSGLSDEEKAEGRKTLARFARGVQDQAIPEPSRDATLQMMATKDAAGNWQIKQSVTDDELRAFLAAAKSDADAAQIVDQPEVVDPSEELKKIVDEALGAAPAVGGGPPAGGQAPGGVPMPQEVPAPQEVPGGAP
jgi:hypothetical protein